MNELQVFTNEEFGDIRSMMIDETPWFVGKDVCQAFGDTNHNRSLGRIDNEDKRTVEIADAYGRMQSAIFINESGLYSLLFTMQPQKAHNDGVRDEYPTKVQVRIEKLHKFKRWVTSEVLPAIRKTGTYNNPQAERIDPQAAYTGAQRLGDVVELAKLMARLMKDNKRRPADILQTVGTQLEQFGVPMPDSFYISPFTPEDIVKKSNTVAAFLSEYGSVLDKSVGDLYCAYLDYCRRTGNNPINTTYAFGSEIVKQTGIHTKSRRQNGKAVRVYTK